MALKTLSDVPFSSHECPLSAHRQGNIWEQGKSKFIQVGSDCAMSERRVQSHPPGENLHVRSDLLVPQLIPRTPASHLQRQAKHLWSSAGLDPVGEDQDHRKFIRDLAPAFYEGYRERHQEETLQWGRGKIRLLLRQRHSLGCWTCQGCILRSRCGVRKRIAAYCPTVLAPFIAPLLSLGL